MLVPGNNGLIEWKYDHNKELHLSWFPPVISYSKSQVNQTERYKWMETSVVCSDNLEFTEMDCKCLYTLDVFDG